MTIPRRVCRGASPPKKIEQKKENVKKIENKEGKVTKITIMPFKNGSKVMSFFFPNSSPPQINLAYAPDYPNRDKVEVHSNDSYEKSD